MGVPYASGGFMNDVSGAEAEWQEYLAKIQELDGRPRQQAHDAEAAPFDVPGVDYFRINREFAGR